MRSGDGSRSALRAATVMKRAFVLRSASHPQRSRDSAEFAPGLRRYGRSFRCFFDFRNRTRCDKRDFLVTYLRLQCIIS